MMQGPVTDAAADYYGFWEPLCLGAAVVAVAIVVQLERIVRALRQR